MANFSRENCRAIGAHITTTANTTIYSATGYPHVIDIRCANLTSNDVPVTISWYSIQDSDQYRLIYQHPIPANGAITFPLDAFAPIDGDEIRVQAGSANAIDVILTIAEVPGRFI
ncbi:hypothetical protein DKP76_11495 [Falsochrobactrum shanghaiense]|uniref:Uncharacterized protein n=1 Tax=Falsochrobactrum shanghaiense TaxID=2201899 RepID=A0A316J9F0_9HYPH|nr:hypothetical protein [Falsochrobactrum shanghaiense]PWL17395.1 hypothetical protein DKP76_11495 [Falsochrobactrum shanghaiense]